MPREKVYSSDAERLAAWRERRRQEDQEKQQERLQQEEQAAIEDRARLEDVGRLLAFIGDTLRLKGWATPDQARSLQAFCRVSLRHSSEWLQEWQEERRRLLASPDRWDGATEEDEPEDQDQEGSRAEG